MEITKRTVDALKPGQQITDSRTRGFRARCLPSGLVTFSLRYRNGGGQRHELPLGLHGTVTVDQARKLAMQKAGEVAGGADPAAERKVETARAANTVNSVLDERLVFLRQGKKRSADEVGRIFDRHVRPAIGDKVIYDLERDDVSAMLKRIAAQASQMARCVRANLNAAFEWHRDNDGRFNQLVMPSLKSVAAPSKRDRILDRDEIRDLWAALETMDGVFPALVRTLLLTACRRDEVASMHTREIRGDVWTIPASRYKTKRNHVMPLVAAIRAVLPAKADGFLFASNGFDRPFDGFSKAKARLDQAIAELRQRDGRKPMPHWTLHDLRRTARSHMEDAGILPHIAERLLGHVLGKIEGTYNHKDYSVEKADALVKWAAYIDGIINPSPKLVALPAAKLRQIGG